MNSVGGVIGLPITNHSSPITLRHAPDFSLSKVTLAQGKLLTFWSDIALATSHHFSLPSLSAHSYCRLLSAHSQRAQYRLAFRPDAPKSPGSSEAIERSV